jgi:hypothetical protein
MRRLLFSLLLPLACNAHALTLRLCTLDQPFPPHTMPDGSGVAQVLLRHAAREEGITIRKQCRASLALHCPTQVRRGGWRAGSLPARARGVRRVPMAGPLVDETRALSVVRFVVYRQKGGSVQWDGSAFSGLDARPVGLQVGLAVAQHLRQTGVTVDEGAKTIGQNLEKLVRGRLQAVVALEGESQPLVEHLSDRIEVLPKAFDATPIYLQVRPAYYSANREAVEKLWNAVRRARKR